MSDTEKVALIAAVFNVAITLLKAVAYLLTGSLAILAETWHSLTDIVTSIFVFLSVTDNEATSEFDVTFEDESSSTKSLSSLLSQFTLEHWVSLGIGLFLLTVSGGLIYEALSGVTRVIQFPLWTGVAFILFSIGNYIVYKFEVSKGEDLKSVGLISDGMHSKADMVTDLLVGFSLIIYDLGIQSIDRWTALFVTVFIFSYSIETIVNVLRSLGRADRDEILFQDTASEILDRFLRISFWVRVTEWLGQRVPAFNYKPEKFRRIAKYLGYGAILFGFIGLGWSCVFQVNPDERALVERFGTPISKRSLGPGLHFKFPYPISTAIIYPTENIHSISVGNRLKPDAEALLWTKKHGRGDPFLAGDNLFFFPYFEVQFKVDNLYAFKYKHRDSVELLRNATYRTCNDLFVRVPFFKLSTTYRERIGRTIHSRVDDVLDAHDAGIEVVSVNLHDIHPPIPVADAYEDVVEAIQAKKQTINEGYEYRNQLIPSAEARADSVVVQAKLYSTRKVRRSSGEARRFRMKATSLAVNPRLTYQRMYMDMLGESLRDTRKVIVDPRTGIPKVWLGLEGSTLGSFLKREIR